MKIYETLSDAYLGTLEDVLTNYDSTSSPRGQKVFEKFDYIFKVTNPKNEPIVTKDLKRNKVIEKYTIKEYSLYESMSNSVEDFEKASPFWKMIANEDGTINSAYGYLIWKHKSHGNPKYGDVMMTPWEWAKYALRSDKDTRQAVLRFSLPEHFWKGNKDFTCTLHGYFQIRDNKLSLSINMRSNDLTLGLTYDLPWFISLIYKMREELLDIYPDLEIGTYTHMVHNIHIYERDLEKVKKMLGK